MAVFRSSKKNENGEKMILIRSKHHLDFRMNETPNPNVDSEIFAMQRACNNQYENEMQCKQHPSSFSN